MDQPYPPTLAEHRAYMPAGTKTVLNARSLQTAHRRLAEVLQPGLTVLDVGCGTGAITRGMAAAVAPHGRVVGIDVNAELIAEARRAHRNVPGLSFEVCTVHDLPWQETFDIVHAARVLQWLAQPLDALHRMAACTTPGGRVMVLDYNHEKIVWEPQPPHSMQVFYRAFLQWRREAGMDNAIADRLVELFTAAGLVDIVETPQHDVTHRTNPDFAVRLELWAEVAASRGHQMVQDRVITEPQRAATEAEHRAWIQASAISQRLYMLTVEGRQSR